MIGLLILKNTVELFSSLDNYTLIFDITLLNQFFGTSVILLNHISGKL